MKHPNQATLALHAGGDLGPIAGWLTKRHLEKCGACREEAAAFAGMREMLPELAETPEVPWSRVAAEMKANIRLGLAAGECVRAHETPLRETPFFTGARAVVAFASIVALAVTTLVLDHPRPAVPRDEGPVAQATADGVQVNEGGQALRLLHPGAEDVTFSMSAQGSAKASYTDPNTGYLTVNVVYAQ